jgi:Zn-dependent peptidase ImmA (M78 family)/transcriptional regulator with XRE-family HTH domain
MNNELPFNGAKLTEARELNERTMVSLAEEAGLSRVTISAYESGKQVPRPENLYRLATILGVKVSFFTAPSNAEKSKPTYFRSFAALTKRSRESALRRFELFQDLVEPVCATGLIVEADIPDYSIGASPEHLTELAICNHAMKLRKDWGLTNGPISSVTGLLDAHGIFVVRSSEFGDHNLGAFSEWGADGRPYICFCSDKHSAARANFTYAHELAHLILHREIPKAKFESLRYHKIYEHQADCFASEFLLPAQRFAAELPKFTLDYFLALKPRWKVSVAAMIKRCSQLGWITEADEKNLWIQYSRRGWRGHEPYDDDEMALEWDEPRLLTNAIRVLDEEGILTKEELYEQMTVPEDRLARMFGLRSFLRSRKTANSSLNRPTNVIMSNAA